MIIVPAIFEGYRSLKDKTLKITLELNELNPQELLTIIENLGEYGYFAFKVEPFSEKEKEMLDNIKSDFTFKGKTSSQRLRSVLYLMWQQNNEGFDSSVKHYEHHMEIILNQYKNNLP